MVEGRLGELAEGLVSGLDCTTDAAKLGGKSRPLKVSHGRTGCARALASRQTGNTQRGPAGWEWGIHRARPGPSASYSTRVPRMHAPSSHRLAIPVVVVSRVPSEREDPDNLLFVHECCVRWRLSSDACTGTH
jgi:hypothetical protein